MLGSQNFVEQMRPSLEQKADLKEIPRAQRLLHRLGLKALFTKATRRNKAIRQAHQAHGYSMADIARHAGVHYSTVNKVIKGHCIWDVKTRPVCRVRPSCAAHTLPPMPTKTPPPSFSGALRCRSSLHPAWQWSWRPSQGLRQDAARRRPATRAPGRAPF